MVSKSNKDNVLDLLMEFGIHIPTRTIVLTGEVDQGMYDQVVNALTIFSISNDPITVELNSMGGDWYSGIAIHDRLKACKSSVIIRASGSAMSMGSVILQAGSQRLVSPGTTVMIHDGADAVEGSPDNVLAWAKHGESVCEHMYKIYAAASKKSVTFWKKRCKTDLILSAKQAVDLGLADGIFE